MVNHLKMNEKKHIISLHSAGLSNREIERKTGHHRDTIGKIVKKHSKQDKVTIGATDPNRSPGTRSKAHSYHKIIIEKLQFGRNAKGIHTDLVYEHEFTGSYESIKRYVSNLKKKSPKLVGRMVTDPGQEAQIDFGQGAPVINTKTGRSKKPNLFVMTLSCSRHMYQEVAWRQDIKTFIQCQINGFNYFGGVTEVVVLDNLKSGIKECSWHDFIENPQYESFAEHCGFAILPHRPKMAKHKGKVERSIEYVQGALRGKKFKSLDEQNEYLRWWNKQIACTRIHGSLKRQVLGMFEKYDKPALHPLPLEEYELFDFNEPRVHTDGYLQVEQSFYSVPEKYIGRCLDVRWTNKLVRIFDRLNLIRIHQKTSQKGVFVTHKDDQATHLVYKYSTYQDYLKEKAQKYGVETAEWVGFMFHERGKRSYRVIQGVLGLKNKFSIEIINRACLRALENNIFRYQSIKSLCIQEKELTAQLPLFSNDHEFLRSLEEYQKLTEEVNNDC